MLTLSKAERTVTFPGIALSSPHDLYHAWRQSVSVSNRGGKHLLTERQPSVRLFVNCVHLPLDEAVRQVHMFVYMR